MPGHWGVAARVERGACVNILGSAMAQAARKGLARPLASAPRTRVVRRVPCQGSSPPDPDGSSVEAFLVSTMVVGLAEIGDKTQILSLMLAARFSRPLPINFGILFATIANHAIAGLVGSYFGDFLRGPLLRWILGLSFMSVAAWALFPDKYEGSDKAIAGWGAFASTLI